ncbi:MAG: FtsW/RodA/SpoVE family cell cycle protein [Bifidobacteriaceae bacterium]|nr:FtsW/RodA/SpoVE family cell cycle protein [Bifidobacteriaceae bacterium]
MTSSPPPRSFRPERKPVSSFHPSTTTTSITAPSVVTSALDSSTEDSSPVSTKTLTAVQRFLCREGLLLLAFAIGALAFWQMMMRVAGTVPPRYAITGAIDLVLALVLSFVLDVHLPRSAEAVLPIVMLLSEIGITEITRIDYEQTKNGAPSDIGIRQMIWLAIALVLSIALVTLLRDYRRLRRVSYVFMVFGLVFLLSPMIPGLGQDINGAQAWIRVGSFSCQPSEFAKLFLAVFFAAYLFNQRDRLAVGGRRFLGIRWPRFRDFGPLAVVWVLSMGILVIQHDLGASLMFFAMFVGMLFVASNRKSWLLIGTVAFIMGVVAADRIFSTFASRVDIWEHPFSPALYGKAYGGSYQLVQGIFGLAAGGLWGTGFGFGEPAITPFANSDFIYTSLGEEGGLILLVAILLLYLVIIATAFVAAMHITDGFGKLLASGLAFSMAFQVFTIVGGVTLVIPLTGLTLPYLAAGGSSLVANWLLAMLVLIVSNAANSDRNNTVDANGTWIATDADKRNGLVLGVDSEEDNNPRLSAFLADRFRRRSAATIAPTARSSASTDSVKPTSHGSHRRTGSHRKEEA